MGAEGLKKEGQQQNAEGKGQEAQGQLSDLGSGVRLPYSPPRPAFPYNQTILCGGGIRATH